MLLRPDYVVGGHAASRKFQGVFPHRHVVLPVIHVESEGQALRNAEIARSAEADGVFLINRVGPWEELLAIHRRVREELPDWWIGVNCLDLDPEEAFERMPEAVPGLWVDDAGVDERTREQPEAEAIAKARQESGWGGLYFGGVAFKYQRPVEDLARAAAIAVTYMDVVTTSGPGTGLAARRAKIVAMKEAVGDSPWRSPAASRPRTSPTISASPTASLWRPGSVAASPSWIRTRSAA